MSVILVKNSLNSSMTVRMDVNIHQLYKAAGEVNPVWLLGVETTATTVSGFSIRPAFADVVYSADNVDSFIADSISKIASQVDWGELEADSDPPYVSETVPKDIDGSVPIESNVYIDIKDNIPSAGIDLTNLNVKINNGTKEFDITNDCSIDGNPFSYTIKWSPKFRNYCTYNGG